MHVADRDTYNDTFCAICGEIADVNPKGLCEDCETEPLLPDGDMMLFCEKCERRTQHTKADILPSGFFRYICCVCPH